MGEPDFTNPGNLSHGQFDSYFAGIAPLVKEGPVVDDFHVDDPACESSPEPEPAMVQVKEEASDELGPHPGYTMSDMNPTTRDARCKSDTKLACFWPVYVGNFRCTNRSDEFESVKAYFAWKGLHARWWFCKDDEYYHCMKNAGLYDMLVYFVSEQDANRAIRMCHRETFKGHTLNVFPGREPVYFDPSRTLRAKTTKRGGGLNEQFFEQRVKQMFAAKVEITCTVKFGPKNGAMEFATPDDMAKARATVEGFTFGEVTEQLPKQRFLEQDVLWEIGAHLTYNPGALDVNPADRYLQLLLQNQRPSVNPNPKKKRAPVPPGNMGRIPKKRTLRNAIVKALKRGQNPLTSIPLKKKKNRQRFEQMVATVTKKFKKDKHRSVTFPNV